MKISTENCLEKKKWSGTTGGKLQSKFLKDTSEEVYY